MKLYRGNTCLSKLFISIVSVITAFLWRSLIGQRKPPVRSAPDLLRELHLKQ